MSAATEIGMLPPTLPEGCFPLTQQQVNLLFLGAKIVIPQGINGFIFSPTEPEPENRDKIWLTIDVNLDVTGMYYYSAQYSKWLWPVGKVYNLIERRIFFVVNESEIWSADGGDGTNPATNPPTATTGAMWQRETAFDARFLVGAGALPSGNVLSPQATGGEESVKLTIAQLPTDVSIPKQQAPEGVNPYLQHDVSQEVDMGVNRDESLNVKGKGEAHNNMPPYAVVIFAKRTARTFYTP